MRLVGALREVLSGGHLGFDVLPLESEDLPQALQNRYITQLVDEFGEFVSKNAKLANCGVDYAVVSIMGPQSSGIKLRTKGIWLAECVGIEPFTMVMDLEGNDGKERGQDTAFEKQVTLFALAVSDILLINMFRLTEISVSFLVTIKFQPSRVDHEVQEPCGCKTGVHRVGQMSPELCNHMALVYRIQIHIQPWGKIEESRAREKLKWRRLRRKSRSLVQGKPYENKNIYIGCCIYMLVCYN